MLRYAYRISRYKRSFDQLAPIVYTDRDALDKIMRWWSSIRLDDFTHFDRSVLATTYLTVHIPRFPLLIREFESHYKCMAHNTDGLLEQFNNRYEFQSDQESLFLYNTNEDGEVIEIHPYLTTMKGLLLAHQQTLMKKEEEINFYRRMSLILYKDIIALTYAYRTVLDTVK